MCSSVTFNSERALIRTTQWRMTTKKEWESQGVRESGSDARLKNVVVWITATLIQSGRPQKQFFLIICTVSKSQLVSGPHCWFYKLKKTQKTLDQQMTILVVSSLSKLLDPEWNALFDPFFSDSSLPFFFILLTYKTLSDHQPVTQRLYFFHFISFYLSQSVCTELFCPSDLYSLRPCLKCRVNLSNHFVLDTGCDAFCSVTLQTVRLLGFFLNSFLRAAWSTQGQYL